MTGSEDGGSFSFPMLKPPQKEPLTAKSTVVHATSGAERSGGVASTSAPAAVVARKKVPLEKGFSQVEWLRLSRSGQDMTGGAGLRREVSMDEVKKHKTADDAWMVIRGKVYNITPYLNYHPGGKDILVKAAGRDGTSLFQRYHPWVNAHGLLEKCYLGNLGKGDTGGQQQLEGDGASAQQQGLQGSATGESSGTAAGDGRQVQQTSNGNAGRTHDSGCGNVVVQQPVGPAAGEQQQVQQ